MIFAASAQAPALTGAPERVKCLIVDDVAENLIALEALLKGDDVDILKAESGPQALELLLAHPDVALALLDVQMPEMNGFELAELVRGSERTRHIPLIFMTAGSRDQQWQFKGYETGAVDFLYKPIDPHMLVNKAKVFFELQRQKYALARELRERTEALYINDMFMAVLSHDLRGPLSAIMACAALLQRSQEPETVRSMAERVKTSGRRMGRMIEDLLDVTRARQHGGLAMTPAEVDLGAQARRAVQEVHAAHPQRQIQVHQAGDLQGLWDGERLNQVLANLLGNAVHHGSSQEPVELHLDGTAAHEVIVRVTNGGEIPPDRLRKLFEPFYGRRADAEPNSGMGLGLGLFIVQQIVAAHGGRVQPHCDRGQTTFEVRLPRRASVRSFPNGNTSGRE